MLAEALEGLKTMEAKFSTVEQAIVMLTSTKRCLGFVVTVFKNVKLFWDEIGQKCRQLNAMKNDFEKHAERMKKSMGEPTFPRHLERLTRTVHASGRTWMVVGILNHRASEAIKAAKDRVDGVVSGLPSGEVTSREIEDLVNRLVPKFQALALKDVQ